MRDKIISNYEKSINFHKINKTENEKKIALLKELMESNKKKEETDERDVIEYTYGAQASFLQGSVDEEEKLIKDLEQQLNYIKENLK